MFAPLRRALARAAMLALGGALGLSLTAACLIPENAFAEPALWKVEGPQATVYLFGTVHVLKPGVVWRSDKIDAALKASDSLWLEVTNADDQAAMQPLVVKYGLDTAHPLSTKLDPKTKADLDALLGRLGVPPAQLEPMRPWLVGLSVSLLPLVKAGYDPNSGVEHILKTEFVKAGKPVQGLETAEQQIRYLAETSPETEMDFLRSSIDEADKTVATIDQLVAAWAAGDEATVERVMNSDLQLKYPVIYQRLIAERNTRFAAEIAELLKGRGVIFIAIGAGHLVGPDSVQADLAKLGVKAVRQ
jgi:uncharacterized protein YbaP (TraB family)